MRIEAMAADLSLNVMHQLSQAIIAAFHQVDSQTLCSEITHMVLKTGSACRRGAGSPCSTSSNSSG